MEQSVFLAYASIVDREFGIQLPLEKKALLESRLQRLFKEGGPAADYRDAASFLKALKHDPSGHLLHLLAEAITTHHTYFLREADHFTFYRDQVLPWLAETVPDGDIRTWCAACSTGQEAYTLAMLMQDRFGLQGSQWEKVLLATDISRDVLDFARRGVYQREDIEKLPDSWKHAYFQSKDGTHVQVSEAIRQQVLFRPFNLMTPVLPFKRPFHVIFCRNVMIYFDSAVRRQLVRRFYDFLVPGGYLFVGHSETVERQAAPFQYVMPSVYRRPLAGAAAKTNSVRPATSVRPAARPAVGRPISVRPGLLKISHNSGNTRLPGKNLLARQDDKTAVVSGRFRIIALGASTGGTEALAEVIRGLRPPLPPIVIVQHIPCGFSRLFAERLNQESAFTAREAADGDWLLPNHIYVAPGDRQMRVRRMGDRFLLSCRGTELVNGHCPSVDVLFQSVAVAAGKAALGVILTGMGNDGGHGLLAMRKRGADTLGQDEQSSVVYGMPRVAYELGAVRRQLPLAVIAPTIMGLAQQEGGPAHDQ